MTGTARQWQRGQASAASSARSIKVSSAVQMKGMQSSVMVSGRTLASERRERRAVPTNGVGGVRKQESVGAARSAESLRGDTA